ncbi:(d)CMP kinase [uncultured Tateyamaria sp.]|uniref:(d)CMP kinase n=1 Tax=Tateyamaria sp. 1078 TaxID=3417464 RepID=UPI002626CD0C|nr:(d)CMP kinase [uncultured Tateyamaria sp.]
MSTAPFTVAIDGPAAAGKGTVSRALAQRFGLAHLDTGLLYRAVGAQTLDGADPIKAARALVPDALERDDLRTAQVAQAASKVAVMPEVRAALLDFQRAFARRAGGAVLDGRDICTVICPQAEAKLFVTASDTVRAARRHAELLARGDDTTLETVLRDVRARDARDAERAAAPMRPADDAHVLDTSDMSITDAVAAAIDIVAQARAARGLPVER